MSPFHVWWFFLWHPHMLQSPSRSCIRTLVRLTFRLRDKLFFSPLRLQGHLCLLILIIYRCFPVNIIRWLRGWSFFCTRYFHSDAVILYRSRSPDIGHHSSVISLITGQNKWCLIAIGLDFWHDLLFRAVLDIDIRPYGFHHFSVFNW